MGPSLLWVRNGATALWPFVSPYKASAACDRLAVFPDVAPRDEFGDSDKFPRSLDNEGTGA